MSIDARRPDAERPASYEIRVRGHLDGAWTNWFEGWVLERAADGTTRLTGRVVDQAALHGLLKRVRDLGIDLISVVDLTTPGDAGTTPIAGRTGTTRSVGTPDTPEEG